VCSPDDARPGTSSTGCCGRGVSAASAVGSNTWLMCSLQPSCVMQTCDSRWQMMPASPTDKTSASLLSRVLLHLVLSDDVLDRSRTKSISARREQAESDQLESMFLRHGRSHDRSR
jgi:hypothetical protein